MHISIEWRTPYTPGEVLKSLDNLSRPMTHPSVTQMTDILWKLTHIDSPINYVGLIFGKFDSPQVTLVTDI